MRCSGSGKLDPDLEGAELLFHQKGGLASFGTKMMLSFGFGLYEPKYWIHLYSKVLKHLT
jgi:hypothetical protein